MLDPAAFFSYAHADDRTDSHGGPLAIYESAPDVARRDNRPS
jgi:hypothetical protein